MANLGGGALTQDHNTYCDVGTMTDTGTGLQARAACALLNSLEHDDFTLVSDTFAWTPAQSGARHETCEPVGVRARVVMSVRRYCSSASRALRGFVAEGVHLVPSGTVSHQSTRLRHLGRRTRCCPASCRSHRRLPEVPHGQAVMISPGAQRLSRVSERTSGKAQRASGGSEVTGRNGPASSSRAERSARRGQRSAGDDEATSRCSDRFSRCADSASRCDERTCR
jgi:hypothetical protein